MLKDQQVLITGASSGIGKEFARQLAALEANLVLTARRENLLEEISQELHSQYGISVEVIPADLAKPAEVDQLISKLDSLSQPVELVINNAGFGSVQTIQDTDPARIQDLISVNIAALTKLTYHFLPKFLAQQHGGIINVASIVAFQPVTYMAAYSASKAYVLFLTEALSEEIKKSNVRLMALCPGTTRTAFFDSAGAQGWLESNAGMTAEAVVRQTLKAYHDNQRIITPGWQNKLMRVVSKLVPHRLSLLHTRNMFRDAAHE